MQIYLSLLVAVLGLLVFVSVRTNTDLKELGRIAFAFGLLAFLLTAATHVFSVVK